MSRNISLLICVVCIMFCSVGRAAAVVLSDIPTTGTWVTNGAVTTIACTPGTIYIGGSFTRVGPATGSGVPFSATTGQAAGAFPKVTGTVKVCISDGKGGWYIGGFFTQVGTMARNNIAHILANGRVDGAWNPNVSSSNPFPGVYALAVAGGTVYAGGKFDNIGGQARNNLAALDAATGQATGWNPNPNGEDVLALVISGGTVYAGGSFTSIGGQPRNAIAALDPASGLATDWNPAANYLGPTSQQPGIVYDLAVSNGTVYVGGSFAGIGGQWRNNIGAVDIASGTATAWNPGADEAVTTLVVAGGTVYAAGSFTKIGGQGRNHLAALNTTTGAATVWNPNLDTNSANDVYALAVSGGTVYAGGNFTSIGGQARNCLAALDAATGAATAWNPNPNDEVYALAVSGGTVYAGGQFTSFGGVTRNRLAALDAATGAATAWNPNPNSGVQTLAVSGGTVYAGGEFTSIGGKARNYLAALDAASGAATAWNPNASGGNNQSVTGVYTLAVAGGTVYAGGNFTSIGGQARNYLAALDAASGAATAWNPNAIGDGSQYSPSVLTLAVSGGTVYVGGSFANIGGQARNYIAALDAGSGAATAWNPNANAQVRALAVSGGKVYGGGLFTSIGGQTRNYLAALDTASGMATTWNPNASSYVFALLASGGQVYAEGSFGSIGGQTRHFLAAVDAATGLATAWNPNANGDIGALATSGGALYVGGYFRNIGGQPQAYFAQFDPLLPPATALDPGATNVQTDRITWAWDDDSLNETGFKVWSDQGTGAPATLRTTTGADTASWLQTGLKPNTQYTFQVAATNAAGDSARTVAYTTWTLIEPVSALTFPTVGTTSLAVAPANTFTNLTVGVSGIYISNDTAGTASNWVQSAAPWVSGALTPNTQYAFHGRSRNGVRISGANAAASQWTLPLPPSIGTTLACDQTTGTVRYLGTAYTFSNPAGFGASTHGGSPNKISAYRWVWDTSPSHSFSGSEATWSAGTLALTPASPGTYYLHLQALNGGGAAQPAAAHYGPFPVQAVGRLAASAASLSFTRASGGAVNVELGGQPTAQNLTLTNTGSAPLNFTGGSAGTPGLALVGRCAADFQIAQVTPATSGPLAPGATVTVVIRFAPQEKQITLGLDAALTITTDSSVTPALTIPLLGDAVPVRLSGFRVE